MKRERERAVASQWKRQQDDGCARPAEVGEEAREPADKNWGKYLAEKSDTEEQMGTPRMRQARRKRKGNATAQGKPRRALGRIGTGYGGVSFSFRDRSY